MHLLFQKSQEAAGRGLGLLRGETVRPPKDVKAPHMGWNNLHVILDNELLNGIDEKDYFYFAHRYYVKTILCKNGGCQRSRCGDEIWSSISVGYREEKSLRNAVSPRKVW